MEQQLLLEKKFKQHSILTLVQMASPPIKQQKTDILGLTPGMSKEAVQRVFVTNGWRCGNDGFPSGGPAESTCITELGQLTMLFAQHLNEQPLIFLRLFFRSADTPENIAQSISNQYGAKYTMTKDPIHQGEYRWQLSPSLRLSYFWGPRMLDLRETALEIRNEEAEKATELRRNPTPRF